MKTINQLDSIDKPREKLLKNGASSLKDYELVSILLGSGIKGKDVFQLSREIVKHFQKDFPDITLEKLSSIHGLGTAKASQILSAIELSQRYLLKDHTKITSPKDVYEELREYRDKRQEYFLTIYLDGANRIIEKRVISIGILNQSVVHPREVFAPAMELRAASIIVAHNHPSGVLEASREDIEVTYRLKQSAELLGIEFLDHIIITKDGYISVEDS